MAGPSAIVRHVYHEHISNFGEPDEGIKFDRSNANVPIAPDGLDRVDVFVWKPDEEVEMCSFSTMGMCDRAMSGVDHRCELHFAVRLELTIPQIKSVASFLANLSNYPFDHKTAFDWWHKVRNPGEIPLFPKAECLILHPRFVADGWDTIAFENTEIRILNVIPLPADARELRTKGELWDFVWTKHSDPFSPW